uniref:Reverse transcriptase domain-containing protein n=1 Tax=Plectus sambesii TaxID=2011161 RepID=A0A914WUD7_9BILA
MTLTNFRICTFNARSLCSQACFAEFQAEVDKIKQDVIDIAEVKRRRSGRLNLPNDAELLYAGHNNKTAEGVGFYVSPHLKSRIARFNAISPRVAKLLLYVDRQDRMLRLIQFYAPTSTHNNTVYNAFLDDVSTLLARRQRGRRLSQTIIMGDFNAKIGMQQRNERALGRFGFGVRNERGERLANFCNNNRLFVLNTLFRKSPQRKWTWRSPNGTTKNEIDYIISNDMRNVTDVSVLNSFNTSSDHRLICTTFNVIRRLRPRPSKPRYQNEVYFNQNFYKIACSAQLTTATPPNDEAADINRHIVTNVKAAMQLATTHKPRTSALSVETLDMLQQWRELKQDANVRNSIEFAELCKTICKAVQHHLQQHHLQLIDKVIRTGFLKRVRSGLTAGRCQITTFGRNDGTRAFMTAEIMDTVRSFYESLYRSSQQNNSSDADDDTNDVENDNTLPFLESKIRQALQKMKSGTSPGYDGITAKALSADAESLAPILTHLFNNCLDYSSIPEGFASAKTILLYKKGDVTDIKNYSPISLLNTTYKVFTKVIGNRINSILDAAETAEQAGFRQSFSTIDHIHAVNELIKKTTKYKLPLFMVFADYEKAFDSVENTSIWQALKRQNVPSNIITILKSIYRTSKSTIHIGDASAGVEVQKGVRQGNTISPRLLTACLCEALNSLNWQNKGINIDGCYLLHLAFADDVVIISHRYSQLCQMVKELVAASLQVGLKINIKRTKLFANCCSGHTPIKICGEAIERVDEFVYLGQLISFPRDLMREIRRRIQAGWNAFRKYRQFFTTQKIAMKHKRRLFNMYIVPSILYGVETWALTKAAETRLATTQRQMERRMIGARLIDHISNEPLRGITKIRDLVQTARQRKWRWARKVAVMSRDRWARQITERRPRIGERDVGRPWR